MADDQGPPRPTYGRAGPSNRQRENRGRATQARDAAEALFRPKPRVAEPPPPGAPPQNDAAPRPRALSALPLPPSPNAVAETPVEPQHEPSSPIPASDYARIRAWVANGLTLRQVADMYGVPIEDVRRILRNA
jgi:hypothetical protein